MLLWHSNNIITRKLTYIQNQNSTLFHQSLSCQNLCTTSYTHKKVKTMLLIRIIFLQSMQQTCHLLDKSQLSRHIWYSKYLSYSWTFHLVSWSDADVVGLDSASWSKQTVDGVYTCVGENLDTAVSETLSGTYQNINTRNLIIMVSLGLCQKASYTSMTVC